LPKFLDFPETITYNPPAMTYDETLAYIFSRGRFGMKPGLERVTEILARLGNPHEKLKAVQIAGTNGKGSTGAFLSSIMTAAGYRTAFFSSPHLMRFTERFRINNSEVSEDVLHEAALRVLQVAPAEATFFEIVTAIAFLLFAEAGVELAIMEAGMGGRWDATNVANSVLSIITPISLDHCAWLGNSVALIAAEKAGIIKSGAPVVIAPQEPDALLPLTSAAEKLNSKVYVSGRDFRISSSSSGLVYSAEDFTLESLELSLRGGFQFINAASAITVARLLMNSGFPLTEDAIRKGLATAVWPGRLELFEGNPPILLDGAHNPAGALSLGESLKDFTCKRLFLVFGVMADKEWQDTLLPLLPLADRVIAVEPAIDRALAAEELTRFCRNKGIDAISAGGVSAGLETAKGLAAPDDLILVTGSLFTVGEARSILTGNSFMPIRG
jgi:dihydrofolate synthase/folylpolyglutamate synthase